MAERTSPQRGLSSIRQARELRQRRPAAASSRFWLWSALALAAILIFYWKKSQAENEAHRIRILSRQRAIAAEMGPLFFPFREKIEQFTRVLAADPWQEQPFDSAARKTEAIGSLLRKPGVYLRLAQPDAAPTETLRNAAAISLKDAFLSCFLRSSAPDPHGGPGCRTTKECKSGEVCNEVGHCGTLTQPYNLRVAYRGTRVLSDEWVHEVETASEELRLRLFEQDLNNAMESDIPIAVDLLRRAQYFLVVMDEIPPGLVPRGESTLEESVQTEVHPTRVGVIDLSTGVSLARFRRTVDVSTPVAPAGALDAQRRQVLNCALAHEVQQALNDAP